jgi:hypothetical protein
MRIVELAAGKPHDSMRDSDNGSGDFLYIG